MSKLKDDELLRHFAEIHATAIAAALLNAEILAALKGDRAAAFSFLAGVMFHGTNSLEPALRRMHGLDPIEPRSELIFGKDMHLDTFARIDWDNLPEN